MNMVNHHDTSGSLGAVTLRRGNMRYKLASFAVVAALMVVPSPALSGDWKTGGEVELRGVQVNESSQMSKFNEYRDIKDGAEATIEMNADKDDKSFVSLWAENPGKRTQDMSFKGGQYGEWGIGLRYNQSPHNFWDGGRTIFNETSPGVYVVDDRIQAALQGATYVPNATATTGSGAATTTTGVTDALVRDILANGHPVDMSLDRKMTAADLNYNLTRNIRASVNVSQEVKQGNRAFATVYTFGQFRESEEPINTETTVLNGNIGYQDDSYKLMFNYNTSSFTNKVKTATYDNPYVATDSHYGTTATYYSDSAGYVLTPDNNAYQMSLSGAASLPLNGRFTGIWSMGQMKQNDPFALAWTNSLLTQPSLSRASLDGKVDTQNRDFRLDFDPVKMFSIGLRHNYYHYDNKTEMVDFYGYVVADRSAASTTVLRRNLPLSFEYTTWAGDIGFKPIDTLKLGLGYDKVDRKRINREVEDSAETGYKLGAQYRPIGDMGWLFLKGNYGVSQIRGSSHYVDVTEDNGYLTIAANGTQTLGGATVAQLPMLQKYDVGDKNRDEINIMGNLSPENWSIAASFISRNDIYQHMDHHIPTATDFPAWAGYPTAQGLDSLYGMQDNKMNSYGLDVSYAVSEELSVTGFYNYEKYSYTMKSRRSANVTTANIGTAGAAGIAPYTGISPYEQSDWTQTGEDTVSTYGFGVETRPIKEITFSLNYTQSDGKGSTGLAGPFLAWGGQSLAGSALVFGSPIVSNLPDTTNKLSAVMAKVDYHLTKKFSLGVSYMYEKLEIVDWALDNVNLYNSAGGNPGGVNNNGVMGNILLGVGNPSYDVSVYMLTGKMKF